VLGTGAAFLENGDDILQQLPGLRDEALRQLAVKVAGDLTVSDTGGLLLYSCHCRA
jgi:hypothetical protein